MKTGWISAWVYVTITVTISRAGRNHPLLFRYDKALRALRALVIDEVHLLYNTPRGLHRSIFLERLKRVVDPARMQLVALSATIADLKTVGSHFFGHDEPIETLAFEADRPIEARIRVGGNAHEVARRTSGQEGKLLAFVNRRKDCQDQAKEVSGQKHLEGAVFVHNSTLALATRLDMEQRCQQFKTVCVMPRIVEVGYRHRGYRCGASLFGSLQSRFFHATNRERKSALKQDRNDKLCRMDKGGKAGNARSMRNVRAVTGPWLSSACLSSALAKNS